MKKLISLLLLQVLLNLLSANAADIALFNSKAIGGSIATSVQLLADEHRPVQMPTSVSLDISKGKIIGMELEYPSETTFEEIVRSIDKKYSKYKVRADENKTNGAKIQTWIVDKTYSIVAGTNAVKQSLIVILINKPDSKRQP